MILVKCMLNYFSEYLADMIDIYHLRKMKHNRYILTYKILKCILVIKVEKIPLLDSALHLHISRKSKKIKQFDILLANLF